MTDIIKLLTKNKCNIAILLSIIALIVLFINKKNDDEDCGCD